MCKPLEREGVNEMGSKASKQMRGDVNKSSLERGSLDGVLIASTKVHNPEKGVNNAGPKASLVVKSPGKGYQEVILEASRVMLGDIDGYEVAKAHSSGCSTHSVRLSDPINDSLLGEKRRNSVMEGLKAPLLDSNTPVMGVDKGNHCKENNQKRVLKHSMQGSKDYWSHHRGESSIPSPKQGPATYKGTLTKSDLEMARLFLLWIVMEEVCEVKSGDHVAVFSDNQPTVLWVDQLASKSSVVAGQLLRALALILKMKGEFPLTPFYIAGNQNDMKDILSRLFVSEPKWHCKTDADLLLLFNKKIPLPNKASWTVFHPTKDISMKLLSVFRMEVTTMEEWT